MKSPVFWLTTLILLTLPYTVSAASTDLGDYMSLQWNYTTKEILSGVSSANLDGDSVREVVAVDSAGGTLHAFNRDGTLRWKYAIPGYIFSLHVVDLDRDGRDEVLIGSGGHLTVVYGNGSEKAKYSTRMNNVRRITSGDVDGDGYPDIVLATYGEDCGKSSYIYVVNRSYSSIWTYTIRGDSYPYAIHAADIDGDSKDEVLIGLIYRTKNTVSKSCERNYNHASSVIALDENGVGQWEYTVGGGVTCLTAGDIEFDGTVEVIAGTFPDVVVIDRNGGFKWNYTTVSYVESIEAEDIDGDGNREVIAASNNVYVLDASGRLKWMGLTDDRVYEVDTGDTNNDTLLEVLAGSNGVYLFDDEGDLVWRSPAYVSVGFVEYADLDGDSYSEVISGAVKTVRVFKTEMQAKIRQALSYYDAAKNAYTGGDYVTAMQYIETAWKVSSEYGSTQELVNIIELRNKVKAKINEINESLAKADQYYSDSTEYYIQGDCINASIYAQKARAIYSSLHGNTEKVDECDDRINKANACVRVNATVQYERARSLQVEGKYGEAFEHALAAKTLFEFVKDSENLASAEELYNELEQKVELERGVVGRIQSSLSLFLDREFLAKNKTVIIAVAAVVIVLLILVLILAGSGVFIHKRRKRRRMEETKTLEEHLSEEEGSGKDLSETVDEMIHHPLPERRDAKFIRDSHRRPGKHLTGRED